MKFNAYEVMKSKSINFFEKDLLKIQYENNVTGIGRIHWTEQLNLVSVPNVFGPYRLNFQE